MPIVRETAPGRVGPAVSLGLAIALLCFAVFSFLVTLALVYRYGSPIQYWDQWSIVSDLMHSGGHPTLAEVWAPNNEHLMPLGKLACYADLLYFGGKNISLYIENFALQILSLSVLCGMVWKYGRLGLAAYLTVVACLCFCLFTPIQIETFYWGFEVTSFLNIFAAILAMAACVWHADSASASGGRRWFSPAIFVAIVAALAAELTMASGAFLWLILLGMGYVLRFPKKTQWLMGGVSALAVGLFLAGFRSPSHHTNPLESAGHPMRIFQYVRTYFAFSWDASLPTAWTWPTVAESFTCLAMVLVVVASCRLAWKRDPADRLQTFLLANMVFGLLTAGATALGRLNFGVAQATSGRYQTNALIFWGCFLAWCVIYWVADGQVFPRMIEWQAVLLLVFLSSATRTAGATRIAQERYARAAQSYAALVQNRPAEAAYLSPYPDFPLLFAYVLANHMGPDPALYRARGGGLVPITPAESAGLQVHGFQVAPAERCNGFMDSGFPVYGTPNLLSLGGWGWSALATQKPKEVVLALANGQVVGTAFISIPRPDVKQNVREVAGEIETGWAAEAVVPDHTSVRAFLELDGGKFVCPLPYQYRQP